MQWRGTTANDSAIPDWSHSGAILRGFDDEKTGKTGGGLVAGSADLAGRQAAKIFDQISEVALAAAATSLGDIAERKSRRAQHLDRHVHSDADDVLAWSHPQCVPHDTAEMTLRLTDRRRQILGTNPRLQMIGHENP